MNAQIKGSIFKSTLIIDGEAAVLNAGMKPEVLAVYRANQITGVKGKPNGTSTDQGHDVSPAFMNIHAEAALIAKNNVDD